MTYKKIIIAIPALQELARERLPVSQAYALSKLRRDIDDKLVFFNEEKQKLISSELSEKERNEKYRELLEFEVEITAVRINEPDIKLSCEAVENLSGLIEFCFENKPLASMED